MKLFANAPLLVLCLTLLLFVSGKNMNSTNASTVVETPKVVYHVDYSEIDRFSGMLTSVFNMVSTYESQLVDYDVRIVFLGAGIRFVTPDKLTGTKFAEDKEFKERREELKKRLLSLKNVMGVKIILCDITKKTLGLSDKQIYSEVELVVSGVVEIANLQTHGFSYLKAG